MTAFVLVAIVTLAAIALGTSALVAPVWVLLQLNKWRKQLSANIQRDVWQQLTRPSLVASLEHLPNAKTLPPKQLPDAKAQHPAPQAEPTALRKHSSEESDPGAPIKQEWQQLHVEIAPRPGLFRTKLTLSLTPLIKADYALLLHFVNEHQEAPALQTRLRSLPLIAPTPPGYGGTTPQRQTRTSHRQLPLEGGCLFTVDGRTLHYSLSQLPEKKALRSFLEEANQLFAALYCHQEALCTWLSQQVCSSTLAEQQPLSILASVCHLLQLDCGSQQTRQALEHLAAQEDPAQALMGQFGLRLLTEPDALHQECEAIGWDVNTSPPFDKVAFRSLSGMFPHREESQRLLMLARLIRMPFAEQITPDALLCLCRWMGEQRIPVLEWPLLAWLEQSITAPAPSRRMHQDQLAMLRTTICNALLQVGTSQSLSLLKIIAQHATLYTVRAAAHSTIHAIIQRDEKAEGSLSLWTAERPEGRLSVPAQAPHQDSQT